MIIDLQYGESKLAFTIPSNNISWIVDRHNTRPLDDPISRLRDLLKKPVSGPALKDLGRSVRKVVILVDDNTRPTPAYLILPTILNELNESGVNDESIEIMIALGTHRRMTKEELLKKLGNEVIERVKIYNFNPHDEKDLVNIGKTSLGFNIIVSKRAYNSDLILGVGNIVPHCYAGWAGGGKIVQPGICGIETIEGTHIIAGKTKPIFDIAGKINHPVRRLIDEIALKVGLKFIVNTILNEEDKIIDFAVGDPLEAFREGVNLASKIYCPKIPELADIVIVSSYPADLEYWQASKPLDYACLGVKKGGIILLVTPCPEGISTVHPELKTFGNLDYEKICELYDSGKIKDKIAAAALMLHSQIMNHAKVICVSHGLNKEDKKALGFIHAETIEEALQKAYRIQGEKCKIGIMKCGDIRPVLTN